MPKTFNPDEYKIENKNEDSLFKNFRDELVSDLEDGFSAISTDLDDLYTQIEEIEIPEVPEIPEVTPAEEQAVTFTEAETKENIATGDTIKTLFGKVAKWFSSFGALAWKSKVETDDIDDEGVTNAKLSKMPANTIKGYFAEDSESSGQPCDLTIEELMTVLNFDQNTHTHDYESITGKPDSFVPSNHAESHHSGAADALSPESIGAATADHDHAGYSTHEEVSKAISNLPTITISTDFPVDSVGKDGDIWIVYEE